MAAGYRAIESLRLEKGYRVWGSDITSVDTPFEAGLGFAVAMSKEDFIGRRALEGAGSPARRLACLVLDDASSVVLGEEPVRVDGCLAGRVTSGGYGYSVARSIAYAYLPAEHAVAGRRVEVNLFGQLAGRGGGSRAALRPGERPRARPEGASGEEGGERQRGLEIDRLQALEEARRVFPGVALEIDLERRDGHLHDAPHGLSRFGGELEEAEGCQMRLLGAPEVMSAAALPPALDRSRG